MIPILINYKVIHHTYIDILRDNSIYDRSYTYNTLPLIHQWRLMICIAIDNGSNNIVGGRYYSAHHVVGKFAEHLIDMVSCVNRKCQTRAGVSGDVDKTLEYVILTDSKFSNRVL